MFYFHWLALCVLSCSVLVSTLPESIQCGRFLPADLQERVAKDCIDATMALFSHLPSSPSELHRERVFSHPRAFTSVRSKRLKFGTYSGYRLPKFGTHGICAVSLAVRTPSGQASSTIGQLSEDLVQLGIWSMH
jgi:hypothetical protein